jgi:hypothetical protein
MLGSKKSKMFEGRKWSLKNESVVKGVLCRSSDWTGDRKTLHGLRPGLNIGQ